MTATAPTDAHHTLAMPDSAADASKLSRPAQLLLVRLLASAAAKRPPTRAAVLKDLRKLLPELPEDDLTAFHQQLAAAGLADAGALRLTEAGRAHALSMLGLGALPAKPTWKSLLDQHLFPLAAGVAPDARETRQKLRTAGFLKSYLVRKHYGLTGGPTAPLAKVLEALACRELGFPEYSDLKSVQAAVLSRLVGSAAEPLKLKDLEKQVPRTALGVSNDKPDTLRGAVIRRWLAGGSSDGAVRPSSVIGLTREPAPSTSAPSPPPRSGPRGRHPPPGGSATTRSSSPAPGGSSNRSRTRRRACRRRRRSTCPPLSSGSSRPTARACSASAGPTWSPRWTRRTSASPRRAT